MVDQYELDAEWERRLRPTTRKLMVIYDLTDRRRDCDILLDQNFYADMQTHHTGKSLPTMVGLKG